MKQELTEEVHLDNLRRLSALEWLEGVCQLKSESKAIKTFLHDLDERVQYAGFIQGVNTSTTTIDGDTLTITIKIRRVEDKEEQARLIKIFNQNSPISEF